MTEIEALKVAMQAVFAAIDGTGDYFNNVSKCDTNPENQLKKTGESFPYLYLWRSHAAFEDESDLDPDANNMPVTVTWVVEGWVAVGYDGDDNDGVDSQTLLHSLLQDIKTAIFLDPTWGGLAISTEMLEDNPLYGDSIAGLALEFQTHLYVAR